MNTLTRGGPGIPFILTSLVFHGLNTFLVFFLSLEILRHACKASLFAPGPPTHLREVEAATLSALLFGVHPRRWPGSPNARASSVRSSSS